MKLWIWVFCFVFTAGIVFAGSGQPSQREQLGIKKLPKTEKEVLQYSGLFLRQGWTPNWSGIKKPLIKKTFKAAFDKKGKIKTKWVERFRRILKEANIGTLSDPIPPEKKGDKWEFYLNTQGTMTNYFTVEPTSDPIRVTHLIIR